MRIRCPTCKGLGTVDKVYPHGTIMGYSGPNGESWPQELCQTCSGEKWIEDNRPVRTSEDEARDAINAARKP